jgi:hypothetical protein
MDLAGNGHAITILANLDQSAGFARADILKMEWQRITSAPFDRDLELAVIDYDGVHALAFPCRRVLGSWIKAETKHKIDVYPTHWRAWQDPG